MTTHFSCVLCVAFKCWVFLSVVRNTLEFYWQRKMYKVYYCTVCIIDGLIRPDRPTLISSPVNHTSIDSMLGTLLIGMYFLHRLYQLMALRTFTCLEFRLEPWCQNLMPNYGHHIVYNIYTLLRPPPPLGFLSRDLTPDLGTAATVPSKPNPSTALPTYTSRV